MQRENLPTCQGDLVKREPTDISCVFPEAGLTLSRFFFSVVFSFGLLYLKLLFSFLSLTPLSCVCILTYSVTLTVSFPPFQFCCCSLCYSLACAQKQSVSLLVILCSEPEIHTLEWWSPFLSLHCFFLHVLIEFLPQPHLVHQVSDRQALISMLYDRLNGTLLLVIQALKKLSLSLSLPFLPALFRQPASSHCSPSSLVSKACSSPALHLRGRE